MKKIFLFTCFAAIVTFQCFADDPPKKGEFKDDPNCNSKVNVNVDRSDNRSKVSVSNNSKQDVKVTVTDSNGTTQKTVSSNSGEATEVRTDNGKSFDKNADVKVKCTTDDNKSSSTSTPVK